MTVEWTATNYRHFHGRIRGRIVCRLHLIECREWGQKRDLWGVSIYQHGLKFVGERQRLGSAFEFAEREALAYLRRRRPWWFTETGGRAAA
jgi:hypothetical protein